MFSSNTALNHFSFTKAEPQAYLKVIYEVGNCHNMLTLYVILCNLYTSGYVSLLLVRIILKKMLKMVFMGLLFKDLSESNIDKNINNLTIFLAGCFLTYDV